jgi:hypothetical protein
LGGAVSLTFHNPISHLKVLLSACPWVLCNISSIGARWILPQIVDFINLEEVGSKGARELIIKIG